MNTRTKLETVTFHHPFSIDGVDGVYPAGSYAVQVEEEVIESLSLLAYRRLSTSILIPIRPHYPDSVQSVVVDPSDLTLSIERDRATEATRLSS